MSHQNPGPRYKTGPEIEPGTFGLVDECSSTTELTLPHSDAKLNKWGNQLKGLGFHGDWLKVMKLCDQSWNFAYFILLSCLLSQNNCLHLMTISYEQMSSSLPFGKVILSRFIYTYTYIYIYIYIFIYIYIYTCIYIQDTKCISEI